MPFRVYCRIRQWNMLPYIQQMIYFTSSWDDGAVTDLALAELLSKYKQRATFFIPLFNVENRAVIRPDQILDLSDEFEIGAHTMNHKYLTTISDKEALYEITESKKALEDIVSRPVDGFCFPGGKYRRRHLEFVKNAGFKYARTINQFRYLDLNSLMDTTLQAHNHSRITHLKHLLKRGYLPELMQNVVYIARHRYWHKLLLNILHDKMKDQSGKDYYIHLWGHSWEIEEHGTWNQLESFFSELTGMGIKSVTNGEMMALGMGHKLIANS